MQGPQYVAQKSTTTTLPRASASDLGPSEGSPSARTGIATISGADTGLDTPEGLSFDSSGNLYVGWFGFSAFNVIIEEYAPGATTGTNLNLDLPSNSFPAYGLVVDPKGNLDVWYESLDHTVKYLAAFPPGTTEPGFTIQGGSFLTNVFGMTFSRKGNAYFATPNDNAVVDLRYPKGVPLDYIAVDAASGIALSPGS